MNSKELAKFLHSSPKFNRLMVELAKLSGVDGTTSEEDYTVLVSSIRRRRAQMLVHSYLYYKCDDAIISDDTWQKWADELTALQQKYPWPIGFYDEAFDDWSGATGCHLPVDDWVIGVANRIYREHQRRP